MAQVIIKGLLLLGLVMLSQDFVQLACKSEHPKPEMVTENAAWWDVFTITQEPRCEILYSVPSHQLTPSRLYQHINIWLTHGIHSDLAIKGSCIIRSADGAGEKSADGADPEVVVVWGVVYFLNVIILVSAGSSSGWKWCRSFFSKWKKTALELRQEQRIQQEKEEKETALKAISKVLDTVKDFPVGTRDQEDDHHLGQAQKPVPQVEEITPSSENPVQVIEKEQGEWGSRLQKYWFLNDGMVITVAPISKNCFLDVKCLEDALNKFLHRFRDHPLLQPITYIRYVSQDEREQVAISQPFWSTGSLRDLIYGEKGPTKDWADKYTDGGTPLPVDEVAKYGRQILEGMTYLYKYTFHEIALNPLGHVHVGNIYIDGENCRLGGYENTLLGYRTRLYRAVLVINALPSIDIIMFGHVIYEMSSGKELEGVVPTQQEYAIVEDEQCSDILYHIFATKIDKNGEIKFLHSINKIKNHQFFTPRISLLERTKSAYSKAKSSAAHASKRLQDPVKKLNKMRKEKVYDRLPQPVISSPVVVSSHVSLPASDPRRRQRSKSAEPQLPPAESRSRSLTFSGGAKSRSSSSSRSRSSSASHSSAEYNTPRV